jgi:hypothetical protein
MATFEELFPDQAQAPFEPIKPRRIQSELRSIGARAAAADNDQFMSTFNEMLGSPPTPQPEGEMKWGDTGRAIVSGVGDIGASLAGTGEYFARKVAGEGNTPLEQGAADLANVFTRDRRDAQQFAEDWSLSMSPEAQARAQREILNLDPDHTIFQGGVGEVLSSISLKMARSLPSTAVTLLPAAAWMRAGLGTGAVTYLGATEGVLSMGSIAAGIAREVEQTPEKELMQAPRYAQLRQTMDSAQARQVLSTEAQGYAPMVGGLVVGAISAAAGKYLQPVFERGGGLMSRTGRGFLSEAGQEAGQSGAEQVAQNYAAQVFDMDRTLGEGVGEASAQGAVVGGPMGGGMAAAFGRRKPALQRPPPATDAPAPATPAGDGSATFESIFGVGEPRAPQGAWVASGDGDGELRELVRPLPKCSRRHTKRRRRTPHLWRRTDAGPDASARP